MNIRRAANDDGENQGFGSNLPQMCLDPLTRFSDPVCQQFKFVELT
ncbi:hypothetical protein PLANPX_2477 [Lacipirellula parvula]|uniref:Uncharacterized protein n=1 Tax=Lacipirellula parvula TaxID=2650471 RepID=A0A5K7X936_9BACT|nr:hypothetical protein PLANPX_2477 [Lacipirellula parvula]